MQIALLGRAAELLAARRARDVCRCRGPALAKIGSSCLNHVVLAADHHAVAALQSPDAAARADVDIVDSLRAQFLRAPDVVDVVGIAAVDEDVAWFKQRQIARRWSRPRPPPEPSARPPAAWSSFFTKSASEVAPLAFSLTSSLHRLRRPVEDHALMAALQQPPHHVRAHPAKTDHSELHCYSFLS